MYKFLTLKTVRLLILSLIAALLLSSLFINISQKSHTGNTPYTFLV